MKNKVIYVPTHSYNTCLLSDYYVAGTAVNREGTLDNKAAVQGPGGG